MPNFLRTIRLDDGDTRIFDTAAPAGEWAVSGAFAFSVLRRDEIAGRTGNAFARGFLGLDSFGRSTLTVVTEVGTHDLAQVERRLAEHLVARYGAPTLALAFPAAGEEIALILGLAQAAAIGTLMTVRRSFDADARITETFAGLEPPSTVSLP